MTDQEILIDAIERAGRIIGQHIEPGHAQDPEQTINRLIAVLDTQEVGGAIERLKAGFGLKVVK
jgi:hypothetical protein